MRQVDRLLFHTDGSTRSTLNLDPNQVGYVLSKAGIAVSELYVHERDIEELFVGLMGAESSRDHDGKGGVRHV